MAKITLLLCFCSTMMFSQNISGTLYDAEAPISGAKIMNITSKSLTSTDGNGNFEIYAQINDTLIFSSLFHHSQQLIVKASHFSDSEVFELKQLVNQLDEVEVQGSVNSKVTDGEKETKRINKQFKSDVERNPHLYKRPNTNSGPIDFLEIGRRVAKLFKRKTTKEHEPVETKITAADFDHLFKTDKFFNDKFLVLNLNITKDYKHLFFAYCETQGLTTSLLHPDNSIYLTDKFLDYSETFRDILKESRKQ